MVVDVAVRGLRFIGHCPQSYGLSREMSRLSRPVMARTGRPWRYSARKCGPPTSHVLVCTCEDDEEQASHSPIVDRRHCYPEFAVRNRDRLGDPRGVRRLSGNDAEHDHVHEFAGEFVDHGRRARNRDLDQRIERKRGRRLATRLPSRRRLSHREPQLLR